MGNRWCRTAGHHPGRWLHGPGHRRRDGDGGRPRFTGSPLRTQSSSPTLGVRFHPGLLPHLLEVPAQQLLDQVVPLAAVSRLEITPTHLKAPKTLLTLCDAEADKAMRVARALADGESVVSVAEGANWSTRQLRRLCASWFGYGPKHLQRVLRLREAEERLAQGMSMTDAAACSGYADASHLWRDRRDLGPD